MPKEAWYQRSSKETLSLLGTSQDGLSEHDVVKRREQYGPNTLKEKKPQSAVVLFLHQFKNFLILILLFATAFSALIGELTDAAIIITIVVLNAIFGFVQETRAEKAIAALKKLAAPKTIVRRDGTEKEIPSSELVPGDIVLIEEGTKIPADIRLLETVNLKVDEASLTGESIPVTKDVDPIVKAELADRTNMCFMGTMATYGRGVGVVVETGMNTQIGKIANMIAEAGEKQTPLQKRLGHFGRSLGILILGISLLVILVGVMFGYDGLQMILTGISLAVAAIPEGLPAVVTVTLALGLQRLSKRNAIMRRLGAVETLGSTSVICSDKTGTLTKGEMTVRSIWVNNRTITVTGKGYEATGAFFEEKKKLDPRKESVLYTLLQAGALCNNATYRNNAIFGDPTEGALLVAATKAMRLDVLQNSYPRVGEVPFSSERKRMTTIHKTAHNKLITYSKGAPEVILERCTHVLQGNHPVKLTPLLRKDILEANKNLANQALRVLAFAYRPVLAKEQHNESLERQLIFLGLQGMIDPPRKDIEESILQCTRAGIRVIMITGDHQNTAVAIANELNIKSSGVLSGADIEALSDKDFVKAVRTVSVYARVNPEHKVRIVNALKQQGLVCAMTGDGVNDAPALKVADIGVAMGIKGTDVAKEASDMVLADDNFTSIVSAVEEGRAIYDNIMKFILYLLSSNIAEVLIVLLAFFISPMLGVLAIPLLAVHLLWINLVTDGLPALALGVDPPEKNIMKRPPRDAQENILSRRNFAFILVTGMIVTIGTLFLFYQDLPKGIHHAQTTAFTALVIYELLNVFNSRAIHSFVFTKAMFANHKLLLAIGASFTLHLVVLYFPPLAAAFEVVPLTLLDWGEIALFSLSVLLAGLVFGWKNRTPACS